MKELKLFPGAPHDHHPSPGEALLFPPWQLHEARVSLIARAFLSAYIS